MRQITAGLGWHSHQSTLILFQYIQYSQTSPLSLLFFRLGSFPTPLGEKDKNQSQYRGILRGAGGKEYAKSIVGQNTMLAGISWFPNHQWIIQLWLGRYWDGWVSTLPTKDDPQGITSSDKSLSNCLWPVALCRIAKNHTRWITAYCSTCPSALVVAYSR